MADNVITDNAINFWYRLVIKTKLLLAWVIVFCCFYVILYSVSISTIWLKVLMEEKKEYLWFVHSCREWITRQVVVPFALQGVQISWRLIAWEPLIDDPLRVLLRLFRKHGISGNLYGSIIQRGYLISQETKFHDFKTKLLLNYENAGVLPWRESLGGWQ